VSENRKLKYLKEVNIIADQTEFREKAKNMGEKAKTLFKDKAQMKNLENIANSSMKITDILNFIKRQTGKDKDRKNWYRNNFGPDLLDIMEGYLAGASTSVKQNLEVTDHAEQMLIDLLIVREFIRQVVIHYEYRTVGQEQEA